MSELTSNLFKQLIELSNVNFLLKTIVIYDYWFFIVILCLFFICLILPTCIIKYTDHLKRYMSLFAISAITMAVILGGLIVAKYNLDVTTLNKEQIAFIKSTQEPQQLKEIIQKHNINENTTLNEVQAMFSEYEKTIETK